MSSRSRNSLNAGSSSEESDMDFESDVEDNPEVPAYEHRSEGDKSYVESEAAESYSDDDIDDVEEEEERNSKKPKKKAKRIVSDFILQEAEVDDDIDEEEDYEDGSGLGFVDNEVDEVGPTAREIEGRRRVTNIWETGKEEEIEEYLRNKYSKESAVAQHFNNEELDDEITQKTLLPDIKDPNLWMVKCKIGDEASTVLLLMRKFLSYQYSDNPLVIKSAIAPKGIKGYIYVEAYKQIHVKAAIENITNLRMSYWGQIKMVPIKEMTDVLRVNSTTNLKSAQWVRMKRGLYKGDLAQIDYVDLAQNKVHLKLIPRIDYLKLRGALRLTANEDDIPKRKRNKRPPQKLFDPEAIKTIGGEVAKNSDYWVFEGNHYSHKGFLYKNFNTKSIVTDGVQPILQELEIFEDNLENVNLDTGLSSSQLSGPVGNFSVGDNVIVTQGELLHLRGKILSLDDKVIMLPDHEELKDPIEFLPSEIKKYFNIGDHVKVLNGKYEGDTGLIVRIKNDHIIVFSDVSMHEMEILRESLQLCPDVSTGVDSLGKFAWGDLVQLDPTSVGVIIRLGRESFQVLSMHGKVVMIKDTSLTLYPVNRNTTALDMHQDSIKRKDIVKVVDGPHCGRDGEIRHLYRGFAFIYSKMYTETGGIFVCKSRHLQLVGGTKSNGVFDITSAVCASPLHIEPDVSGPKINKKGMRFGGGYVTQRNTKLIGMTIRICGGPYKGSIGIVKDATSTTARVELHSPCQTISVDISHIVNADGNKVPEGNTPQGYNAVNADYTPNRSIGGRTPMYGQARDGYRMQGQGPQTPMYETGARTPYYGSGTPLQDGSRTPGTSGAWDPKVSNTPARSSEYDDDDVGPSTSFMENDAPSTPLSPDYLGNKSSSGVFDSEGSFDLNSPISPCAKPSFHSSPNLHNSSFNNSSYSASLNYTPSSPTESNQSTDERREYLDSPASPPSHNVLADNAEQYSYSPKSPTSSHASFITGDIPSPYYGSPASPDLKSEKIIQDENPNFYGSDMPASPLPVEHNEKPCFYGADG
ncbi:transcription elongation factor SPT5-like [Copidosoma floridanum]|uniref:transcription elongation factor SPT5-like n=1 Tax=Copidosoma floridanum TaxID=29053 RepID=UPI0006C96444|nr:transcription elongation factor SPT5-like [Copidosoma floridanum]